MSRRWSSSEKSQSSRRARSSKASRTFSSRETLLSGGFLFFGQAGECSIKPDNLNPVVEITAVLFGSISHPVWRPASYGIALIPGSYMRSPRKFERRNVSRRTAPEFNLQLTKSCVMISMNWRVIFGGEMDQHNTRGSAPAAIRPARFSEGIAWVNAPSSKIFATSNSPRSYEGRRV